MADVDDRGKITVGDERSGTSVSLYPLDRSWESLLQELDGGDEVVFVDEHHQVDRIEVGFTPKATS